MEDWRFTFGVTDLDAWPERLAYYSEADPPPLGYTYIAVPMTFTGTGAGSGDAWIENSTHFAGNNGVVYTRGNEINGEYYSCASATDWSDAPEIYTGATTSGTQCIPSPSRRSPAACGASPAATTTAARSSPSTFMSPRVERVCPDCGTRVAISAEMLLASHPDRRRQPWDHHPGQVPRRGCWILEAAR